MMEEEKITYDEMRHLRELLIKYEMLIMREGPPNIERKEMVASAREIESDIEERVMRLSVKKHHGEEAKGGEVEGGQLGGHTEGHPGEVR